MNVKDAIKVVEQRGTKISKEILIVALRKTADKDFLFAKDSNSTWAIVRVPLRS